MSRTNPKYTQKDRSAKAAYQSARSQAKIERRLMTRTSYNSIIDRSPASMIAGYGRNGEEKKFVDFGDYTTSFPIYQAMEIALLNGTLTGSGFFNRIGNKITLKSVHIKAKISPRLPVSAPPGRNQMIRCMLIYDRQTNGAYPTLSTILADYDRGGTSATGILSGMNPNQTGRFVILREHFVQLMNVNNEAGMVGQSTSLVNQDGCWWINWFVKLRDLETIYSASTGLIGDIVNGGLYFVFFGDALTADNACASMNAQARLRFVG